jgi:hypothetical protein
MNSREIKSVTGYWLPTREFSSDIFGTFASRSSNFAGGKGERKQKKQIRTVQNQVKVIN